MDAKAPANASHGWRSILAGRDVLKQGIDWLVGDGSQIEMWKEPWLSTMTPLVPMGPPNINQVKMKVMDLISPISASWNLEAIRLHLPQYEDHIRQLMLSNCSTKDRLKWLPAKSGLYSTKSGYSHLRLVSEKVDSEIFKWQSDLWRIRTTPKLKMFLWKALSNALPLGTSLASRGLTTLTCCKRCDRPESALHVFFECSFAAQVWALVPISFGPGSLTNNNMKTLLHDAKRWILLPPTGLNFTPLYPWIMWYLWKARNLLIFESQTTKAEDCLSKSISEAILWQAAQGFTPSPESPPSTALSRSPTINLSGVTSCFSDAAWRGVSRPCGLGWFLRHPAGEIIRSSSERLSHVPSALCGEAIALRSALLAAQEAQISSIVCFTDCQALVGFLNSGGSSTELQNVLLDVRFISSSFVSISFVYISRSFNSKADSLAKSAVVSDHGSSFIGVSSTY